MLKPRLLILPALVAGSVFLGVVGFGQPSHNGGAITLGSPAIGKPGIGQSTADIMAAQAAQGPRKNVFIKREFEIPGREHRPQNPAARFDPQIPPGEARNISTATSAMSGGASAPKFSQTVGLQFDGVTGPTETASFPPDSMGASGPSQFIIFVNGRIRSFNKTTGSADGVMNVDPDVFFQTVMTPVSGAQVNFTSDPQIRYDRLSKRWFLTIIDIPSSDSAPQDIGDLPNRVLIAVSDAASNGVITGSTVWTFFFIQQDRVGQSTSTNEILDYDSLGVDANALYIGGNMFDTSGNFTSTNAYVVRKSSVLSSGPIVVTAFRGLVDANDGPDSPRGVDNYDPNATEGYIIGSSATAFGELVMRRISNPGGIQVFQGTLRSPLTPPRSRLMSRLLPP